MPIRVAINGFGRIGRNVLRAVHAADHSKIEIVAVNDLTDNDMLGHLLKYDSVHGAFQGRVTVNTSGLEIDGRKLKVFSERDPADLITVWYSLLRLSIFTSSSSARYPCL